MICYVGKDLQKKEANYARIVQNHLITGDYPDNWVVQHHDGGYVYNMAGSPCENLAEENFNNYEIVHVVIQEK